MTTKLEEVTIEELAGVGGGACRMVCCNEAPRDGYARPYRTYRRQPAVAARRCPQVGARADATRTPDPFAV